jgi:hypothetical protein
MSGDIARVEDAAVDDDRPPRTAFGLVGFARNDEATTRITGLAGVAAGNDASIAGGLLVAAVGNDARITGFTGVLMAGNNATVDSGVVGILMSAKTELGEDVRVMFGPAQALAIGAGLGATLAAVLFGLRRLVNR